MRSNRTSAMIVTEVSDRAVYDEWGMLHCAIMNRGIFRGYVGFDECTTNRLWTQGQVSTLEFLAEVLAVFLIKQRTLDKLQNYQV